MVGVLLVAGRRSLWGGVPLLAGQGWWSGRLRVVRHAGDPPYIRCAAAAMHPFFAGRLPALRQPLPGKAYKTRHFLSLLDIAPRRDTIDLSTVIQQVLA